MGISPSLSMLDFPFYLALECGEQRKWGRQYPIQVLRGGKTG